MSCKVPDTTSPFLRGGSNCCHSSSSAMQLLYIRSAPGTHAHARIRALRTTNICVMQFTIGRMTRGRRVVVPPLMSCRQLINVTYVRAHVRPASRPRPTATLRMRERCSNSAEISFPVQEMSARKRPSEETRTKQATGPRQAY